VIFSVETYQLESLHRAIVDRPKSEDDLTAIHHAVLRQWVPLLNPERVARQGRAAATSPVLRGLSLDLGIKWQTVIAGAIACRHGLEVTDQRCWLVAALSLWVFSNATNHGLFEGCPGDLGTAIDGAFELLIDVCANLQLQSPSPAKRQAEPKSRARAK
jgi:hypothetical protein